MAPLLERLPRGSRVSIIRLRSLGDCVLTTPAIALLKAHRPDLRIQVVVEPSFAPIFEANPDVEEIAQGISRASLVLNLHGGTRSMWMTAASSARFRVGFAHHRYSFLYSHRIPTAQEVLGVPRPVHTAEHLASAMFWLGVPLSEIPRAKLSGSAADSPGQGRPYAVLHPFASAVDKAWPVERFLELACHLKTGGLEPWIVAGPQDDAQPFSAFSVLRAAPLKTVKNLMAGASLFIGNDSGPAHIAAAFGVPVVVLFGPSNPVTWAPWRSQARVLTSPQDIRQIELGEVIEAAETLRVKAAKS